MIQKVACELGYKTNFMQPQLFLAQSVTLHVLKVTLQRVEQCSQAQNNFVFLLEIT